MALWQTLLIAAISGGLGALINWLSTRKKNVADAGNSTAQGVQALATAKKAEVETEFKRAELTEKVLRLMEDSYAKMEARYGQMESRVIELTREVERLRAELTTERAVSAEQARRAAEREHHFELEMQKGVRQREAIRDSQKSIEFKLDSALAEMKLMQAAMNRMEAAGPPSNDPALAPLKGKDSDV